MKPKIWTIKHLLKVTSDYLKEKGIESPRLTAEVLLAHQLDVRRVTLYLNFDKPLTEAEISGYRSLIRRRLKREPLQYITGIQEFCSLKFHVNTQVLIPRPESELLVEQAICIVNSIKTTTSKDESPMILDLGTGSGALAVSVAKMLPQARVWATDISKGALGVARYNAKANGVLDRIEFRQGDLWEPLKGRDQIFDIILSNPPYVAAENYSELIPEVRDYEPRLALEGREKGLYFIEKIIAEGHRFLRPGGWLFLEMAPEQTETALRIIESIKDYMDRSRIKDYDQKYRIVAARKT